MNITQKILSDIIVFNKYARYIPEIKRRETWDEIVDRNCSMHLRKFPQLREEIKGVYSKFVRPKKVLPSMRSLQFGGTPIEISNARIFNCAYLPLDHPAAFSETMFLLLSGTGVGYGVQKHQINKMPVVVGPKTDKSRRFLIGDSIEGWADAIKVLMKAYFYNKSVPLFDYRDIRPKGAKLITSGGKAPGPDPLRICIEKITDIMDGAKGRRLTSLEGHDIQCHIADAVLSGGIRRAAMIVLFSIDDEEMLTCKSNLKLDNWELEPYIKGDQVTYKGMCYYKGKRHDVVLSQWDYDMLTDTGTLPWYFFEQQRGRANNSVVLHREYTTEEQFKSIWKKVEESMAGEPGIFWTNDYDMGTNPCAEISLNANQFCNLTEINVSDVTDQQDFNERAKAAAFLGTLQASYSDFHYLRPIWKETTEREALLGVGATGIASGNVLSLDKELAAKVALEENERVAGLIGINPAARVTTIKPSGTSSLVLGTSSGIHAWHNDYYIRRVRVGKNEALYKYMKSELPGLIEDCAFKPKIEAVMSFPQQAPKNAIYRTESFMDLLERVKQFNIEWVRTGHRKGINFNNVSCTISLKNDEWQQCGEWMWENKQWYTGISVLPYDNGTYIQAPFENISKEKFDEMVQTLHDIDLTKITEEEDITNHKGEAACAGGACETSI